MRAHGIHLTILLLIAIASPAAAGARRELKAVRTPQPPVIDGRVIESVWELAPPVTSLEQQRPDNGVASSEEIRVHVLYDDDALYVAAVMPHRHSPIVRLLARRDTFLDSDWFGILLDSQYDRRSALGFFVNPEGVQLDEAVTDDAVEDFDWDSVWRSAATVHGDGWSAELRIPFSHFRFVGREKQVWGVQLIRWVRARQEQARFVSHPRNEKGFVSRFGDLVGLDDVRSRPKLELRPYSTSAMSRNEGIASPDPFDQRSRITSDAGLDLRWTARSSTTVNATFNPDFGQVEVDPAILNLSEFELFFPEKRPFFIEGAKLFVFGNIGAAYASPFRVATPIPFYSRRIGREPQLGAFASGDFIDAPNQTRIIGAAKVTGRLPGGTTFSIIDAFTDQASVRSSRLGRVSESLVEPRTNYFTGRLTKDFGPSARIGALVTSVLRESNDATAVLSDRSTVAGVDGYRFFGSNGTLVDWMAVASHAGGSPQSMRALQIAPARYYQRPDADHLRLDDARTSLSGWGARAALSRESGTWRYQAALQHFSPGLEMNDLGFHTRSDLTGGHAQLTWFDVEKRKQTRNNRLTVGYYRSINGAGDTLTDGVTAQFANTYINWWSSSATVSYGFDAIDDRETRGGVALRKPSGWTTQLRLTSNTARRVWFDLGRNDGGDADGGWVNLTQATIGYRPRTNVTLQLAATHATTVVASKHIRTMAAPGGGVNGTRYVFGELLERRLEIAPRVDWTIRVPLTLQVYLQPLAASGRYTRIGELQTVRGSYRAYEHISATPTGYLIDPDGAGGLQEFTISNPDFIFRSFRGNAVLRFEIGSATLFAVWNEGRQLRSLEGTTGRLDDLRSVRDLASEARFLLKASYRFEFPR